MTEISTTPSNAAPRATLVEVPLPNEPATDKAFKCAEDGATYRVRVVPVANPMEARPGTAVAPYVLAFDISVTRLDESKAVVRDANGMAVIVDRDRWTIDAETFSDAHPENTAEACLQRLLEQRIFRVARSNVARASLANVMASWGQTTGTSATVKARL